MCNASVCIARLILGLLVQVAVVRMVQQLSQVYSKLHMSTLEGMVPFCSIHQTEKVIVEAIRHNFLHVRCLPGSIRLDVSSLVAKIKGTDARGMLALRGLEWVQMLSRPHACQGVHAD